MEIKHKDNLRLVNIQDISLSLENSLMSFPSRLIPALRCFLPVTTFPIFITTDLFSLFQNSQLEPLRQHARIHLWHLLLSILFLRCSQVFACINGSFVLLLNSVSFYGENAVCLSVCLLINIWIVFNLGMLQRKPLFSILYIYLYMFYM